MKREEIEGHGRGEKGEQAKPKGHLKWSFLKYIYTLRVDSPGVGGIASG